MAYFHNIKIRLAALACFVDRAFSENDRIAFKFDSSCFYYLTDLLSVS